MYMFLTYSMMFLHMFVGLILIGIILLQRGRGGGLAGAFGGMGGQSAFGTKAGDVFTKITIWLATVWIVLGCVCVLLASNSRSQSSKIREFAPEVKEAAEDKTTGEKGDGTKKGDEVELPAPSTPEGAKPDGVKATDDAADKNVKPDAAGEAKKTEATERSAEEKKNAAEEGGKADAAPAAKESAPEKPAEPAKKPDGEAAAEKAPAENKPE
jgi:preprotein translocase subunit SecG